MFGVGVDRHRGRLFGQFGQSCLGKRRWTVRVLVGVKFNELVFGDAKALGKNVKWGNRRVWFQGGNIGTQNARQILHMFLTGLGDGWHAYDTTSLPVLNGA
jgi:hypothetical protein